MVKVNFDVAEAYRNNAHIKTEQYVRFYRKDDTVKQAVLSPLYGLLKGSSDETEGKIKSIEFPSSSEPIVS